LLDCHYEELMLDDLVEILKESAVQVAEESEPESK
jgi:hypothetical protein